MSGLFNQFSFPLMAVAALALAFLLLRRFVSLRTLVAVEIALALAFAAGFFALRTGEGDIASVEQFEDIAANGKPTFIEFFSNFCTGCLVVRPAVDDLIADIEPEFNIVRVNIHTEAGLTLRERYGFSFTPEFVLLDPEGAEVWRAHVVPPETAIQSAREG